MNAPRDPSLRLASDVFSITHQGEICLQLPSVSKFSMSYAPSEFRQNPSLLNPHDHANLSSSDGEQQTSDADADPDPDDSESCDEDETVARDYSSHAASSPTLSTNPTLLNITFAERPSPQISRALSMPLPSQLSHLHHPYRTDPSNAITNKSYLASSSSAQSHRQIHEVSVELADSVQQIIQTMLQISPPQVLDPAKEQFSACALSVPTSSMSAMFTAMKNINYLSAIMSALCSQTSTNLHDFEVPLLPATKDCRIPRLPHNEFDVGEMLQCLGDSLSGAAAQAGVDLVLYHGDVGLKHVYVSGDESGISFVLTHIIREVLSTADRGDSIEIGLLVSSVVGVPKGTHSDSESPPVDDLLTAAPLQPNGPVQIKFQISHKFSPSEMLQRISDSKDVGTDELRPKPSFSTLLLRRMLRQIDGKLISDLPPPEAFTNGRTCELELFLNRLPLSPPSPNPEEKHEDGIVSEPTLEQLSAFGKTLKGKRVTLYASAKCSFARHLTSYLTAWGMEINHVSPDGQVDDVIDQLSSWNISSSPTLSYNPLLATYATDSSPGPPPNVDVRQNNPEPPAFIFIDDDVEILRERLQALRFEYQPPTPIVSCKRRPTLSGRQKSSPQMARLMGVNNGRPIPVIVHFTGLSNYKVVRDMMQTMTTSYAATSKPLPEVMIIPKPAGPRRFLTALHTAVTKPIVDPLFIPIATSPMSPGVPLLNSFFTSTINEHSDSNGVTQHGSTSQAQSPSSKANNRPHTSRTNSERSMKSNETLNNFASILPPSPLALPDNVEYFSNAGQKLGNSPSSGLVVQSPDGQTTGIWFHPRSKNGMKNTPPMERDHGQLAVPSPRGSTPRIPSGGKKNEENLLLSPLNGAQSKLGANLIIPPSSPSLKLTAVGPPEIPSDQFAHSSSIASPIPQKASDNNKLPSPPASISAENTPSRRPTKRDNKGPSSPILSKHKVQKFPMPPDANVIPPISVLIVDDNPINQTILSTFMRRKKIKYDLANNGQEAVQKWRTGGFHLILMDIQMPVMDGIQATKEIRRLEKCNAAAGYPPYSPSASDEGHTPSDTATETRSLNSPYRSSVIIVALTASSLQSDRVNALAAGCNDFLTKPVSLLWLNNKIIEWGSIKALQMWADIRPEGARTIASGQAEQARNIAERLHVPAKAQVNSLKPVPIRRSTTMFEDNVAALALASSGGAILHIPSSPHGNIPPSPTFSLFGASDSQQGAASPLSASNNASQSNSLDTANVDDVLDFPPLVRKFDDTPKPSTPISRCIY